MAEGRPGARVFVALLPPPALRAELAARVAPTLGRGLRRTRPEHLHLTLAFLGAIGPAGAAALPEALERAAAASRARGALELALAGTGAFPGARRARVLWAGVEEAEGARGRLEALWSDLGRELAARGLPAGEERPFRPHLTVARAGGPRPVRAPAGFLALALGLPWRPDALTAFESRLERPQEERYGAFATASLLPPATRAGPERP